VIAHPDQPLLPVPDHIVGETPLTRMTRPPGRGRSGWVASSHVALPIGGCRVAPPRGGCQGWSPTTHGTPPPGGVRAGALPDQAPLRGLTQTKGAQALSIWAPWRGREAGGSLPIRGGTRSRDQISANQDIPQGLPCENWKILGLSPLGFRGTYESWLTRTSMGQISLPVEECYLIRCRGHQRALFQDRGQLGTGPLMTVLVGWASVRLASPEGT